MERVQGLKNTIDGIFSGVVESGTVGVISSIILTFGAWLLGDWDLPLQILLTLIVTDYITALINAYIRKKVSSNIGFKGLLKKSAILIILILSVLVDRLLNIDGSITRTAVAFFFISNEALSIIENLTCLGLPIPEQLTDMLVQLKKGNRKEIIVEEIQELEEEIIHKEDKLIEIQNEEGDE